MAARNPTYTFSILLALLLTIGCQRQPYAEETYEFQAVFEAFNEGLNETYSSKSMEAASQTATGNMLKKIERDLQATGGTLRETYIISIHVESMNETVATTVIEYRYRDYGVDANSGQKTFDEYWKYHTAQVTFQMEDGRWKVEDMETIDWTR